MTLQNGKIILRPLIARVIPDRIRWETEETEWQLWDGPWEYEGKTAKTLAAEAAEMEIRLTERLSELPGEGPVDRFEICVNDEEETHVGWCGAYHIDEDCTIAETGTRCAVGVCIPPMSARRKGYAAAALCRYIEYLQGCGYTEVYTQTWSGNVRMIALAEKLGFVECRRKIGLRLVRGERYDGLTFRLDTEQFMRKNKEF